MAGKLPLSASVATPGQGAKLCAPSALRNVTALTDLLLTHAPQSGGALEIASGTGQHVTTFAAALPDLRWHPTDVDHARLASIDAYVAEARLTSVAPATLLDATQPGWGGRIKPKDLILLINLLHLLSTPDVQRLITEAAKGLAPHGTLIFYGPFKRAGQLISPADARFDAELRAANSRVGYKDNLDMRDWLTQSGLDRVQTVEMPANNLAFVARKPA